MGPLPAAGNMDLDASVSYSQIVDIPTGACPANSRIDKAGMDPDASAIVMRIENTGACGTQMPPTLPLSAAEIQLIRDWITQGALNN